MDLSTEELKVAKALGITEAVMVAVVKRRNIKVRITSIFVFHLSSCYYRYSFWKIEWCLLFSGCFFHCSRSILSYSHAL